MKNKIMTYLFLVFIFGFLLLNIILPKNNISKEERRYLKSFPSLSFVNVSNGKYFKQMDDYIVDNFIFRKFFRKINVFYNLKVLNKGDYKDYYIEGDYVFKKINYNKDKAISFSLKMNNLYEKYFSNNRVFLSIIPDKSYYDRRDNLNYELLTKDVLDNINRNINYIDISDCLELSDYYYSDIHWRQEKLDRVVNRITSNLGVSDIDFNLFKKNYYSNFYGSYYGGVGGLTKSDRLIYLEDDYTKNASIYDIEDKINQVYETSLLDGIDSYDVYLGGATPLLKVTNNNINSDRELVIFRDSFGSSIVPLLLNSYKSITLVDLRYIKSDLIDNYIDFKDKDILLLYSSSIINSSDIIK